MSFFARCFVWSFWLFVDPVVGLPILLEGGYWTGFGLLFSFLDESLVLEGSVILVIVEIVGSLSLRGFFPLDLGD